MMKKESRSVSSIARERLQIGQPVKFTGGGKPPIKKGWLRKGMVLAAAATKYYMFHGQPLLYVKARRGKKEVRFHLAPSNVEVLKPRRRALEKV